MINEAAALSLNELCLSNSFDLLANKTSLMMMMMMMLIMMMAIHNIFMEFFISDEGWFSALDFILNLSW